MVSDWHGCAVANCDRHRIENGLGIGEVTGVRSHMRRCAGVEEPFGLLGAARRGLGCIQCSKKCLVIPWINGRWWCSLPVGVLGGATGRSSLAECVWRRAASEVRLMRNGAGTRTENTCAWRPERHWPSLYHPSPRVVSWRPAGRWTRRAGTAVLCPAAPTTAATATAVVIAGRGGAGGRGGLGRRGGRAEPRVETAVGRSRSGLAGRTGSNQRVLGRCLGVFLVILFLQEKV